MNKRRRYQLICEGKCNDQQVLVQYEKLSRAAAKNKPLFNRRRNPQPGMATLLSQLVYTTHRKESHIAARCEICLTQRRYG